MAGAGRTRGDPPRARRRASPVFPTLQGYQIAWLTPDLVAGLTLLAIAVPEQMATARLAGMPAPTGLYAFIAGSVLIALFGASRQMSVGADSTIAPVIATGVAAVAVPGTARYEHLVTFLALIVGGLILVIGLLRLGWIADFISTPVVTGILAGIGFDILLRQLPAVLGLPGGGTTTVGRVEKIAHQLSQANGWTVAISAGVLVIIVAGEKISRRIPGALIGLVASIVAVDALGLKHHGVKVLGTISGGLPSLGPPSVPAADLGKLAVTAATVAFVCVVQTASTARSLPGDGAPSERLDQDLIGLGAGNLVAGLTGSFSVDASPPRSTVVATSGGRSQLASLVAAAGCVLVVAFATGLLSGLPQATLGAILIFVATRLFHVKDLRAIRHFDRAEYVIAWVTIIAVALFGIETGVLVALVLALAQRTRMAARPHDTLMGREPGTDHWVPTGSAPTEQVPGVAVYLLLAPLWFGNADYVVERVRKVVASAPTPLRALVLDAAGVADIDFTGAQALHGLISELKAKGIRIALARAAGLVPTDLRRSPLLEDIGPGNVFDNVEAAVQSLSAATPDAP
jgi:SulP family sulfate permease